MKLSQDGLLSGIPSDQSLGIYNFNFTATDEFGSSTSAIIIINIDYPETVILIEKLKLSAAIGSALFSILAFL
jgi:hypothetical protein